MLAARKVSLYFLSNLCVFLWCVSNFVPLKIRSDQIYFHFCALIYRAESPPVGSIAPLVTSDVESGMKSRSFLSRKFGDLVLFQVKCSTSYTKAVYERILAIAGKIRKLQDLTDSG